MNAIKNGNIKKQKAARSVGLKSNKKIKVSEPRSDTTANPLTCRVCGSKKWNFSKTATVEIDFDSDSRDVPPTEYKDTLEELRCANCRRKATLENNTAIRQTKDFEVIKAQVY